MTEFIVITCGALAVLAATSAILANRRWPGRTLRQLNRQIVMFWLVITAALMVGTCAYIGREPCAPDDSVCDGPAMAMMGVVTIGGTIFLAIIVAGVPAILLALYLLRRK